MVYDLPALTEELWTVNRFWGKDISFFKDVALVIDHIPVDDPIPRSIGTIQICLNGLFLLKMIQSWE